MHPFDRERREQRDHVAGMLLDRKGLAPLARTETAQVRHDDSMARREVVHLQAPVVVTAAEAVQQQHGRAIAHLEAGDADAVDADPSHASDKLHWDGAVALTLPDAPAAAHAAGSAACRSDATGFDLAAPGPGGAGSTQTRNAGGR